ncbi:hypothetical protein PRIPAC_86956 [Pristionchus pacificus]|uniref:Homeobox domain-containing protein n=1 Tax=Pristionchus pacificus TaxID=54126 RepID=A0A2A6BT57_PRIPA|nr:hypothetical protein PRIPAC_86956 [Pristionchus pacificus]|eukprot:PDM68996.1 Homeobox domain-containing protein [Pristionchus pacificus]
MVDAVMVDANARKPDELICKQIGELTPPESQRNSTEDSDPSSIENSEDAHVEVELDEEEMVIVDENRVPPMAGEEEIVVDDGKHCDEPPMTPSSISDIMSLTGHLSPSILATASPSLTVASAVATDKAKLQAKQRAIATAIEKYVEKKGGNLYPTREDKEKMAVDLAVNYNQVNRWFANRRRKVTKHRKILGCASPSQRDRKEENVGTEEKIRDNVDECIEAIIEETRRKRKAEDDIESGMVAHNVESLLPVEDGAYTQEQDSMAPPPGAAATAALLAAAVSQGNMTQLNPYLLATLAASPQLTMHLLQQVLQQQAYHAQLAAQQQLYASQAAAMASPVHHHQQQLTLNAHGQPTWMSPPISESPMEELSDQSSSSDFSPRPSSPRFKDPHNIADPQMAKLLAATDLSEKESIAIAVLTEMANMGY